VLTDKGWSWTQSHLHVRLNPQGTNPGLVLMDLLPRLKTFLDREGYGLADLFGANRKPPEEQARNALLALGGGACDSV